LNNITTLKSKLEVTQDHWERHQSVDRARALAASTVRFSLSIILIIFRRRHKNHLISS